MKGLRERDQAVIAVVGTVVLGAAVLLAIVFNRLPFLHPRTTYVAEFASAGGLKGGEDVRVAGVSVGEVESVELSGDHVEVRFGVTEGLVLGGSSSATIEVATVLGNVYLQIHSAGAGRLSPDTPIPVTRTTVPYSLLDAFGEFAKNAQQTDLPSVQTSLAQLSTTLAAISRPEVGATLRGLAKLTSALASRQDEISELLDGAQKIIGVLQSKSGAIVDVLSNSDIFLRMLNGRHAVIQRLFQDTSALGAQISDLIENDGAPLTSALASVDKLSALFAKDSAQLRKSIHLLGQFSVNIANVTGNGPWLDLLLPTNLIPDNVIAKCGTDPEPGCGN
jgi:phospholipid/cholesterol/gamma-HCH transport system substrate-binding protein